LASEAKGYRFNSCRGRFMEAIDKSQVTQWLTQADTVIRTRIADKLLPGMYAELQTLAHKYFNKEREDHILQPTALVNEAYLRLVDQSKIDCQGRTHFFALCAKIMRQILIDYARQRQCVRHGGGRKKVEMNSRIAVGDMEVVDIVALNDALEELAALDEREARVVELRFFGGLQVSEIAQVLDVSTRTVEGDWKHAKAWLQVKLDGGKAA
jgi:RNA polymerase sigma-70 factor, ECF subfamily